MVRGASPMLEERTTLTHGQMSIIPTQRTRRRQAGSYLMRKEIFVLDGTQLSKKWLTE